MTDRHAFLAAIKAHPDDDTPRLVFADWLDEHGEPERAELVRADIEYSKMLALDRYRPDLARRRYRLLLRFIRRYGDHAMALSRGILEEIHCAWAFWVKHGDRLYELERPWRVRLTTRPAVLTWYSTDGIAEYRLFDRKPVVRADQLAPDADAAPVLCSLEWPGTEFEIVEGAPNDVPRTPQGRLAFYEDVVAVLRPLTPPAARSPSPRRP